MVRVDDRNARAEQRRPDESMEIINDLFSNPLDPGYEKAAKRRGPDSETSARVPFGLLIGLGLLGLLLTVAALQVPEDADLVSAERGALIERITSESERTAELEQMISEMQEENAAAQDRVLASVLVGEDVSETMLRTQAALGLGPVIGLGVIIELRDADPGADGTLDAVEHVLDKDLAMVVNGLWAAGAEAISINDERITPLSAIRRVDDVILVNYRPIAPPYEVRAIGDPRTLGPDFAGGSGGAWLRTANAQGGIRYEISNSESLTLPSGSAPLDYAEVKETQ
jgi:uncharacterized protein YlxW (UPF0749 family)